MVNVLVDYHHPALWRSWELLGQRLGWDLFRPLGMDWYDMGYWEHEKFWAGDRFAKMFLTNPPGTINLNSGGCIWNDNFGGITQVGTHLVGAPKFDIVISTVPGNHAGFNRYAKEKGAKHIIQIGNNEHPIDFGLDAYYLDSTLHPHPEGIRYLRYDQEIDLRLYRERIPRLEFPRTISSFLVEWHRDEAGFERFRRIAREMDMAGYKVNNYGNTGKMLNSNKEVAEAMGDSTFVWHTKKIGDGWGHVIHSAYAMGIPVITLPQYYAGMRAERLLVPGTFIDISYKPDRWIIERLTDISPSEIIDIGRRATDRFYEIIDYYKEAREIEAWLQNP